MRRTTGPDRRVVGGVQRALAATGAAMVVVTVAAGLAPVVARGRLMGWAPDRDVERVRLLGIHLVRDPAAASARHLIVATALLLGAGAAVAVRRAVARDPAAAALWTSVAGGCTFLAVDVVLRVHTTVAFNTERLDRLPAIDHPDDVVVLGMAVVAALLLTVHGHALARSRLVVGILAAAAAAGAAALVLDSRPVERRPEEALEGLGAGLVVVALVVQAARSLAARQRDRGLHPHGADPSPRHGALPDPDRCSRSRPS